MKILLNDFKTAAFISFFLVFPFMIVELVNRRNFHEAFPFPLFGILLLLPIIFILILSSIVRNVRAGNNIMANPIIFWLSIAFLALIFSVWAGTLIDQLPCFLGVPNCD